MDLWVRNGKNEACFALFCQLIELWFGAYRDFSDSFSSSTLAICKLKARYARHPNAPEALIEVPTPLPTMMIRLLAPSPYFSQNASSNTSRFLIRATFCGSSRETDTAKVLRAFYEGLTDAVC